jgi:hypothetical protein
MLSFDAPTREFCLARRAATNTPLQALVLLNDPTYVEAARRLAERTMAEGGTTSEQRLTWLFRCAVARRPENAERDALLTLLGEALAEFKADGGKAMKLLELGASKVDALLDPAELAAWATVAGAVLNLDETITKR